MKKLFFAICFNLLFVVNAFAAVRAVSGYENIQRQNNPEQEMPVYEMDAEDFKDMLEESFENAAEVNVKTINENVGYIPSAAKEEIKKEEGKSIFQKIYEEAINRVGTGASDTSREDVAPARPEIDAVKQQQNTWQDSGVPVVTAYLPPDNRPVSVPALEHISYLMNSIEVLPNGLVKFEETMVVVANGEKLKSGLTKILPARIYAEDGKSRRLDYSVIGVTVNDMPVEYRLSDHGNSILLIPEDDYDLPPGIYTYKFEYLVDNLLWEYNDFYSFYWDVGGNGWNLVIDRTGASLSLPKEGGILEQAVLIGVPGYLDENAVSVRPNGRYATAYIASRPLFIGEGMFLMARISKDAVLPPELWQRIIRSFYDYGDIYFALLGLIVIALSFKISWQYIARDKGQLKLSLNKTAMVIRYLLFNRFDVKSVCGFLLELYRKNIIDIQQSSDTILLIKRTDNVKSLKPYEQKALQKLFPGHETVFSVSRQNKLPFKRFAAVLEQGLGKEMLKFRLKLNAGYLFFSLSMLFVTELFISLLKIDSIYIFTVISAVTLVALGAVALWYCSCRRWLKVLARLFALDIVICCFIMMSAVINPFAVLFLLLAAVVIVFSLTVYSKRMGLIKHYIQEMSVFKQYLQEHHDNIVLGKNFLNYQAAIWAYDMEDEFVPSNSPEYWKLPVVKEIARLLSA